MSDETKQRAWEASYQRGENFLFYSNEEVIRFFATRIACRSGPTRVDYRGPAGPGTRVLDFGCGIGRHVKFALDLGLDATGIDLSDKAIATGRAWLASEGVADADLRLVGGNGQHLPFADGTFDVVVSHGVLDSMSFSLAPPAWLKLPGSSGTVGCFTWISLVATIVTAPRILPGKWCSTARMKAARYRAISTRTKFAV
jgi:SAM-dependent methyltransferase